METQEIKILENVKAHYSRLMADFMGFKLVQGNVSGLNDNLLQWRTQDVDSPLWKLLEANEEKQTGFHHSWDWLMPVIDKINDLGKEYTFTLHKTYYSCSVGKANKMHKDFHFAQSEIKYKGKEVECAFKLVGKFLEWYNANKPNENN